MKERKLGKYERRKNGRRDERKKKCWVDKRNGSKVKKSRVDGEIKKGIIE